MKLLFATVTAYILLIISSFIMSGTLLLIGFVGLKSMGGADFLFKIHTYLMWIIAPAFGGFVATYGTTRIFKEINPELLKVSFISVYLCLVVVFLCIVITVPNYIEKNSWDLIISSVQSAALILSAVVGSKISLTNNS